MKEKDDRDVGAFELVRRALAGKFKVLYEPTELIEVGQEDKIVGVVTDPILMSIFSVSEMLRRRTNKEIRRLKGLLTADESANHEVNREANCKARRGKMEMCVVLNLFWSGALQSYPSNSNYLIKKGWKIFRTVTCDTSVFFSDKSHPSNTFFKDVCRALIGQGGSFRDVALRPINIADGECQLCRIESGMLKALYLIIQNLQRADEIYSRESRSAEYNRALAEDRSAYMRSQLKTASDLFILGLCEETPDLAGFTGDVALREEWNVVGVRRTFELSTDLTSLTVISRYPTC